MLGCGAGRLGHCEALQEVGGPRCPQITPCGALGSCPAAWGQEGSTAVYWAVLRMCGNGAGFVPGISRCTQRCRVGGPCRADPGCDHEGGLIAPQVESCNESPSVLHSAPRPSAAEPGRGTDTPWSHRSHGHTQSCSCSPSPTRGHTPLSALQSSVPLTPCSSSSADSTITSIDKYHLPTTSPPLQEGSQTHKHFLPPNPLSTEGPDNKQRRVICFYYSRRASCCA